MSSFSDALLTSTTPLVMEVKRRGAEGEDLFRGRSVAAIVADYERLGAPCISVVTGRWFGGDEELLREVASLTGRPLLRKDFVTRESQIAASREMGAAAVLLTAEVLPAAVLARLVGACVHHGVTPFVEIASAEQLASVPEPGACVIAVNNKDIRRRERGAADLGRSLRLLPELRAAGAGCAVSASGIDGPDAAARLLAAGFDGLLVGTGLLRSDDAEAWLDAVRADRVPQPSCPT
jgi:indole-3-glycerol phosphate synthase